VDNTPAQVISGPHGAGTSAALYPQTQQNKLPVRPQITKKSFRELIVLPKHRYWWGRG